MPLYNYKTDKYAPKTNALDNPEDYIPQTSEAKQAYNYAISEGLTPLQAIIHVLEKALNRRE